MDGRKTRKKLEEKIHDVALNHIIQARFEQIMHAKHAEVGGYVVLAFGYIVLVITNHGLRGSTSSGDRRRYFSLRTEL